MKMMHKTAATAAVAGMMFAGGMAAPAYANQHTEQDGLINVNVEGNEILSRNNVGIGVAANIAAQVCGVKVGPVAVLGVAVDRSGDSEVVCETEQGEPIVTLEQNQ